MSSAHNAIDPGQVAVGTWSGGRFMRFGEPLDDERFAALITPDESISTVLTADVYGTGDADRMLGQAIAGLPRERMCIVGAVGHDFYTGERNGPKGFPRFTDPALRDASGYAGYLRMATERSLVRCGIDAFDLLLLHNPDRVGYTSETVGKLYNRQKHTRFIQKPFPPKALAKIVREALEESAIEARLSVPPFRQ